VLRWRREKVAVRAHDVGGLKKGSAKSKEKDNRHGRKKFRSYPIKGPGKEEVRVVDRKKKGGERRRQCRKNQLHFEVCKKSPRGVGNAEKGPSKGAKGPVMIEFSSGDESICFAKKSRRGRQDRAK